MYIRYKFSRPYKNGKKCKFNLTDGHFIFVSKTPYNFASPNRKYCPNMITQVYGKLSVTLNTVEWAVNSCTSIINYKHQIDVLQNTV